MYMYGARTLDMYNLVYSGFSDWVMTLMSSLRVVEIAGITLMTCVYYYTSKFNR